ncbi:MAG: hypothetical protein U0573_13495 [Phycisphaerales bacterium]|nr:hypothetical protein [Planctomycetota bacterium]
MRSTLVISLGLLATFPHDASAFFGVYNRTLIKSGDPAPGLPAGNTIDSVFAPPAVHDRIIAFVATRSGPNTGPGSTDQAAYQSDLEAIASIFLLNDSGVPAINQPAGTVMEGLLQAAPADETSAGVLVSLAGTGGARRAYLAFRSAASSLILDSNTLIPNSGGRTLKDITDVSLFHNPAHALIGGSLNLPAEIGTRFSYVATGASAVHVIAQPGMPFNALGGNPFTIDSVSGCFTWPGQSGSLEHSLICGSGKTPGGEFGPVLLTMEWIDGATPTTKAIAGPLQPSPPALSPGTVLFMSQFGAGTNNRAAITMTIDRPGMSASEETAIFDLSDPNPWAHASRLLPLNAPVTAAPSAAGAVPVGTTVAGHSGRLYFSQQRFYGNLTIRRPDNQTRVAFSSIDEMRYRSAASTLASGATALLVTQSPAPGLSGPTISSINKINSSIDGYALVEVSLTGTGVTSSNNLAWYTCTPHDEVSLLLRKGQSVEVSPGVFKTLNSVNYFYNAGTGEGHPTSLGSRGAWVYQASLASFSMTGIFVAGPVFACPADLNGDSLVEDADFVIFLNAYNILDCADPTMPAACPADFNTDAVVNDADFIIFLAAYNELVCP